MSKRVEAHQWLERWIEGKTVQNLPANYDEERILDLGELHQALIAARKEYLESHVQNKGSVLSYNINLINFNSLKSDYSKYLRLIRALDIMSRSKRKLSRHDAIVLSMGGTMDDVRAKAREDNERNRT